MGRNYLTVDGTNLSTFGVYISGQGVFGAPEKTATFYSVPGRDGDVISPDTRLNNIEVTYPCFCYANTQQNLKDLRSFLLSRKGYVKISDTYNANEFRMGAYLGPFEPQMTDKLDAGSFDLTFNCKPQRFLTSGETVISATANFTATNPTRFVAKPLWKIWGSGRIDVTNGSYTAAIVISDVASGAYLFIDSESMQIYSVSVPDAASHVQFADTSLAYGADPPVLNPGTSTISLTGITRVELTPRWWEV